MKRCVLNFDLKLCNVGAVLKWIGNMFQRSGAAMAKARSPFDFNFDFGTVKKTLVDRPKSSVRMIFIQIKWVSGSEAI